MRSFTDQKYLFACQPKTGACVYEKTSFYILKRPVMKTHYTRTVGSLLLATTVLTVSATAEAGNGSGGRQGGGFSGGPGAMHGSDTGAAYGTENRNGNQYQYKHQHRHQNGTGNTWRKQSGGSSGDSQYSDDRRLSQKDFQAWLNQNQGTQKRQEQNSRHHQAWPQSGL